MSDRITAADVAKVARLARLDLTADEIDRMTAQLDGMLEHFADIDALDLAAVEPMTQPYPLVNVFRDRRGAARASTATRCSPPRPRPRTAASACRRSSGRWMSSDRRTAADIAAAVRSRAAAKAADVVEQHLAAHRRPRGRDPRLQPRDGRRGPRRRRSGRRGRRRAATTPARSPASPSR